MVAEFSAVSQRVDYHEPVVSQIRKAALQMQNVLHSSYVDEAGAEAA